MYHKYLSSNIAQLFCVFFGIEEQALKIKKIKINKRNFYEKFKIPLENKILFFCGRIHELKGANFLAKIHKNLREKGVRVTTILTGEDIHGDECKKIGGQNTKQKQKTRNTYKQIKTSKIKIEMTTCL